jgi:ABC-type transporter Mla subunit MlaD
MPDRKNLVVGLFVLLGLVLLGGMILWFEDVAVRMRRGYTVATHLESAIGIRSGKRVHMDGIDVGVVREARSSQPAQPGVRVEMLIDEGVEIPAEAVFVVQQTLGGDPYLNFVTAGKATKFLPTDGQASVRGEIRAPSMLPDSVVARLDSMADDFHQGMGQLKGLDQLIASLKEITAPRTLEEVRAGKPVNLPSMLAQFEMTARTLQDEIKDPNSEFSRLLVTATQSGKDLSKTLEEVNKTLATVRTIADTYTKAGAALQETSGKANETLAVVTKDAEEVGVLIRNVNALVENAQQGKGTLGQLLTSDELHRQLVNLVENLQKLSDNANHLMTMWREEGLFAKEKK